jgi:hypothetical protein
MGQVKHAALQVNKLLRQAKRLTFNDRFLNAKLNCKNRLEKQGLQVRIVC